MTDLVNINNKKDIWLDLELRKDIDDYISLIFALENNLNIKEVSINNPSKNELCLLKDTLKIFKKNIPIIISGEITEYLPEEDIHESLMDKFDINLMENKFYCDIDTYLEHENVNNRIVFCGGSLFTLSKILENKNISIESYIQGGYASSQIVGEENVLKKFRKRDKVPTWNLNLDMEASKKVMSAQNTNCHFISKNVCHASFIGIDDISEENTLFNRTLKNYFNNSKRKKCMHDLLALLTIVNKDVVDFKSVDLKHTDDERVKWYSEINNKSNKKISTSFDYDLFLKLSTTNHSLKITQKNTIKP